MKVALVHDWLVSYRGGEKVLESFAELFPDAPIFTLFYNPENIPEKLRARKIITPKKLAAFSRFRKLLLPILPSAVETFDLSEFDLIVSSSSCVAKGAIPGPDTFHISYIHSPMRYIWDQRDHYLGRILKLPLVGALTHYLLTQLRVWDSTSSARVDVFVANSEFVKRRVKKYYRRDAEVIHPPVNLKEVRALAEVYDQKPKDYFIAAGALVPYKRFDLAIEAAKITGDRLIVAGAGPEQGKLQQLAAGSKNIEFRIGCERKDFLNLLANTKGMLFPGVEDFGITPIEALALGTPLLAFAKGGALDYLEEGVNGLGFCEQTPASLAETMSRSKKVSWQRDQIIGSTDRFCADLFNERFKAILAKHQGITFEK